MGHKENGCCEPLAPWERELYGETVREPYVDLSAYIKGSTEALFFGAVRGVSVKDGVLTFEDANARLFYVPNVSYWTTDATPEW